MNRLSRDQICLRALDLADVPSLDTNDRPSGTLVGGAFTAEWLQEGIDWFYQQVPMAGLFTNIPVTYTQSGQITIPSDFLVDLRDGMVITDDPRWRLVRVSAQEYVQRSILGTASTAPSQPAYYFVQPPLIFFFNRSGINPDKSYAGKLYYFQLPAALQGATIPNFPSDLVLVDYVRLKCQEFVRAIPAGSALDYAERHVGKIRKAGLFNEPENDEFPLDPRKFKRFDQGFYYDWLTPIVPGGI